MKFLVDMPLSPALAAWLRDQGHDAFHAIDLSLSRAPDTDILACAKKEERTVITVDLDYPRLLALTRSVDPSLILFRQGNWSDADVIVRMRDLLWGLAEDKIRQSIIVVDRDRIGRRRLPIDR